MKILVIEDEIKIANLIKKRLEIDRYQIELAHDGLDGLNRAKKGNFDLIVLDVMLPKMDGLNVCRNLRDEQIRIPVLMLTAKDGLEDKGKGMCAGADDYMIKPFSLEELASRIKSLLNKAKELKYANNFACQEEEILIERNPGRRAEDVENYKINKLHKKILDNVPVSIITINKEGYMTSANRYFRNLAKSEDFSRNNVFTGNFFVRENLSSKYKKLLEEGVPFKKDNCFETNVNGEGKYLKITAVPIRDEKGNIEGALSMAVDNTEAVLFHNKLNDLNKKLEKKIKKRTIELDKLNEKLNKVLELKSTFMADVSHEMRTSLAIVQCNLELISRQIDSNEIQEEASQIFEEIKRMSTMLSDLSLLANSDSSKQDLQFEKIDIDEKIQSVCKSLKVLADEKNINMRYKSLGKIETIADGSKIEKLLFNLIKNAIKYNKVGGWIKINIKQKKNEIQLTVQDSGIGIAKKHLPYIFERFYRADKSGSRKRGGSGLGLAICKWVANAHGGNIEAKSTLGEGSTFILKLPQSVLSK